MSTADMTAPATPARGGRWLDHWDPEDPVFWENTGKRVANRNLWFSIFSEHIGFSLWTVWSVLVLFMGPAYGIDPAGKFLLVSVPSLIGALIRIPYTMAPARFGGRNWTIVSALLLLVPTSLAIIVMHPGTSFTTFVIVAALGGLGGGNFGWPFCYGDRVPDTSFRGTPQLCQSTIPPRVELQAHSAPLGLVFYSGQMFPTEYRGDLFVALHGSWNRSVPTGYKVIRIKMNDLGVPDGLQDFITGWLSPGETGKGKWMGRPVGLAVGPEGSLYISDDGSGSIYRVCWQR